MFEATLPQTQVYLCNVNNRLFLGEQFFTERKCLGQLKQFQRIVDRRLLLTLWRDICRHKLQVLWTDAWIRGSSTKIPLSRRISYRLIWGVSASCSSLSAQKTHCSKMQILSRCLGMYHTFCVIRIWCLGLQTFFSCSGFRVLVLRLYGHAISAQQGLAQCFAWCSQEETAE